MHRAGTLLVVAVVNVAILAAAFEVVGIGGYFLRTQRFFYSHARAGQDDRTPDTPAQIAEAVFHPFFGYIHRVGRHANDWTTNNHGFQFVHSYYQGDDRCCDYPHRKDDDELTIGIFGGSVAAGFALDSQRTGALGKALDQLPNFAGKKVRILNFSMPGWMQPHQLIALSYYLALQQKLDIVLEIDGFNEVVSIERNWRLGVEPTFPADVIWGEWGRAVDRSAQHHDDGQTLATAYHKQSALQWERDGRACRTASCWLVTDAFAKLHHLQAGQATPDTRKSVNARTLFPTSRMSKFADDMDIYSFIGERWFDASSAMAELTKAQGGVYLHVLQPNQWFRPSGTYDPIDPAHPYGFVITPVNRGYVEMQRRAAELRRRRILFVDATLAFIGHSMREMYIDDCCHYTQRGNGILAELVAQSLAGALNAGR